MATAASLPSSAASASDAVSSQLVAVTEAIALMPSGVLASSVAVSYTHLTLPTIYSV